MTSTTVLAEMLAVVSHTVGAEVWLQASTERGESRSTFVLTSDIGDLVLKVTSDVEGAIDNQHRLVGLVEQLRGRGYPAPQYVGVGRAGGLVFTVQRRLPGRTLELLPGAPPDEQLFRHVLPELLDAIELQCDRGDLDDPPWPGWLLETIETGGDGYCLHDTMRRRPDTSALLDRLRAIAARNASGPVRRTDVVHFDLNPANILCVDGRLSGVIDWNVPFAGAAQGDRGFDMATLLFYSYELDATRDQLWDAAIEISGAEWIAVYLCHLALRQVEWVLRHHPGSQAESRFLQIATRVLTDCEDRGAGSD